MSLNNNSLTTNEITKFKREQLKLSNALSELPNTTTFIRQKNTINNINDKINEPVAIFNSLSETRNVLSNSRNNMAALSNSNDQTLSIVNQQLNVARASSSRINNDDKEENKN
jgi:hypothetical protein